MRNVIQIKVKILNREKNPNRAIFLGSLYIFQIESHDHGRDMMTSCVVLLMMEKLKHLK